MILGIYGSGGLGREVLDTAKLIQERDACFDEIVFINDLKEDDALVNDTAVYTFQDFETVFPPAVAKVVIAVGEPQLRKTFREKVLSAGYSLQTLVHPTAFVGTDSVLGDGTVLQFNAFVSCNTTICDNVFLQSSAILGHDSSIGVDSVVSSLGSIMGNCTIGERVYIGVSTPVRERVTIGDDAIIGMGSVVVRDIPEGVVALGNPARPMKNNETGKVFK